MRNPYFLFIVFGVIGLPFLLGGLYSVYSAINKLSTWQTTQGVITSLEDDNLFTFKFEYQGREIDATSNAAEEDMEEGQSIPVYFPPGNPEEAEPKTFVSTWLFSIIFLVFGISFGGVGLWGVLANVATSKAKKELFTDGGGKKLSNLNALASVNRRYKVNGVSPYIIEASWTDPVTNNTYLFKSENIWFNPGPYIKNGCVDVYIDESNFKRYYVDTTFLPENG